VKATAATREVVKERQPTAGPEHTPQLIRHRALVRDADRDGLHPRHRHRCVGHRELSGAAVNRPDGLCSTRAAFELGAATDVVPDDAVLDRIDEIVPSGINLNPADGDWAGPALQQAARRR
jgi:hypothetical protein